MNCILAGDDDIMVLVLTFLAIFVLPPFGTIANVGSEGIYTCSVV